jgi:CBS domain-containing protein
MHVKDIMNQPVITCSSDSTLNVAAQLMWEHDCGTIPVVDNEGRLAGMITDRDICMAAYTQGLPIQSIPVTSAMTRYALACHLEDSVTTAEELMREGQIRRVPVIDNEGRPVGIVAISDLTRFAAGAKETVVDRAVVSTLAAISTPRFTNGGIAAPTPGLATAAAPRREPSKR